MVQQKEPKSIFKGIIRKGDYFDLTLCNPPFHISMEVAQAGTQRKKKLLTKRRSANGPAQLNFGGQQAELCCRRGEVVFITQMIRESVEFAAQAGWFTSLVSKREHLRALKPVRCQARRGDSYQPRPKS